MMQRECKIDPKTSKVLPNPECREYIALKKTLLNDRIINALGFRRALQDFRGNPKRKSLVTIKILLPKHTFSVFFAIWITTFYNISSRLKS